MKLTIERAALLKALSHVQSVVERRTTIPILSNVLLRAEAGGLALSATDMDLEIVERVPARIERDGRTTAPAHTLYDIVRKLREGAQVELEALGDRNEMVLRSGRSTFTLACLPPEDFPVMSAGELAHRFSLSAAELRRAEDAAIREVAQMQAELGLKGITDGEFRRGSWHMDFLYQIGGVAKTDQTLRIQFRNEAGAVEAALGAFRIGGKLTLDETIFAEDFAFLKSAAPSGTVAKLTIPSPSMLHYRGGRAVIDAGAYPEMAAFWHDLALVYRQEIAEKAQLG